MSYQRQHATSKTAATSAKGQTTRFNSSSNNVNANMNMNPNVNSNSQPSSRSSTNRILDDLLALAPPSRIEHYQPNLSSANENQPPNITIIDYRQPGSSGASSSLWFGDVGDGSYPRDTANKLERKSTFDQFASQFKSSLGLGDKRGRSGETTPSLSSSQTPLAATSGNVKILDIRRTKTNRKRPKTNNNDYENATTIPIQLAHEDDDDDHVYDNHGDAAYQQQERPVAGQQQDDHKQEQSATRNKNQTAQPKQNQQQQQQRQQSGETLSSFESDYDLLVYLGETETEDLVETERSLDYLDQTWRQSICGGASLAPTIDESLSELLSPGNNQQARFGQSVTPTRTPVEYNDDFDLLWTTSGGRVGGGGPSTASPQVEPSYLNSLHRQHRANRNKNNNNEATNQPNISGNQNNLLSDLSYGGSQLSSWSSTSLPRQAYYRQSSGQQRTGGQLSNAPARGRELELLSQQARDTQTAGHNNQFIDQSQAQQQAGQSLAGNIGNKLVSLFGRNAKQQQEVEGNKHELPSTGLTKQEAEKVRQLNEFLSQPQDARMAPQKPRRQQPRLLDQSGQRAQDGNADELDRLLAEMSQSLDLDSLARYDPFGSQVQHRRRPAQNNQAQTSRQIVTTTTVNNSNNQAQSQNRQPAEQQVRNYQNGAQSTKRNESLFNEYDGASRILEQMISDQLDEALASGSGNDSRQQTNQANIISHRSAGASEQKSDTLPAKSQQTTKSGQRDDQVDVSEQQPICAAQQVGGQSLSGGRAQRFAPSNRQASLRDHSSQATSDEERASASSASQVRKISSTCSSVTTETSVLQEAAARNQTSRAGPERPALPASHQKAAQRLNQPIESGIRQIGSRRAERVPHQFSFDGPAPSGGDKQHRLINNSRSLDVPAELAPPAGNTSQKLPSKNNRFAALVVSNRSNSPVASVKSTSSLSSAEVPPKPPAVDYSDYPEEDGPQIGTDKRAVNLLVLDNSKNRSFSNHSNAQDSKHVIQVEASELPSPPSTSSEDETTTAQSGRKRVMNKMKQKTMSGVRNVRQRFNRHFSGPNEAEDNHDVPPAINQPPQPEPPARSSSIGSSKSGSRQEIGNQTGQSRDSDSARQSRQRVRRVNKNADQPTFESGTTQQTVEEGKKSFGQQWRERLSRSKSRFSQFFRPLSMSRQRAKSTPADENDDKPQQMALFEPSDIARNEPIAAKHLEGTKRRLDLNESSLERQLKADLEKFEPKLMRQHESQQHQRVSKVAAKSPRRRSQSSDRSQASGDLSGLETTTNRRNQRLFEMPAIGRRSARSSKRKSRTTGHVSSNGGEGGGEKGRNQKRPTSLMSLKKFGESFGRSTGKGGGGKIDDLDSMKMSQSVNESRDQQATPAGGRGTRPTAASRNKRARNRSTGDQQLREARNSSPTRLETVTPVRATTDDYFGFKAPIKTTSGSEGQSSRSPEVHQRVEMGPGIRPASAMMTVDDDEQQDENVVHQNKLFGGKRRRVPPNRSQSLKGVDRPRITTSPAPSDQPASLDVLVVDQPAEARQKSVSFQNLSSAANQRRPLSPVSPNTFRPVSASPAQGLDLTIATASLISTHQARGAGAITPIPLTPILANSTTTPARQDERDDARLTGPGHSSPSRSPNRERGLLGDLRSKCTEYFHPAASRGQNTKVSTKTDQKPSDLPPSRPPRRRRRRDADSKVAPRSKSLAAPSPNVIEVEPASPPASLLMVSVSESSELAQQHQAGSKRAVKRLTSLAQQLKTSAADFFTGQQQQQQQSQGRQNRRADIGGVAVNSTRTTVDRRPLFRNLDEPLVQNDLAQWRPIIPVNSTGSNARRVQRSSSFRLPKDHDDFQEPTNSGVKSRTLGNQTGADGGLSRRATNEDDSDSTWDSGSDDDTKNVPRKCDPTNESIVQRQDLATRLDDSSSAAASTVANRTDEQQQVAAAASLGRAAVAVRSTRGDNEHMSSLPLAIAAMPSDVTTTTSKGDEIAHGANRSASTAARSSSSPIGTNKNNAEEDQNNNKTELSGDTLQTIATIATKRSNLNLRGHIGTSQASVDKSCKTNNLKPLAGEIQLGNSLNNCRVQAALLADRSGATAGHEHHTTDNGAPDSSCNTFSYKPNQQESQNQRTANEFQPSLAPLQSVNERTFKFNQNLPSPSQILNEASRLRRREDKPGLGSAMTATRSAMGVHRDRTRPNRDEEGVSTRGPQPEEEETMPNQDSRGTNTKNLEDNCNNNRLSIYENVDLQATPSDKPVKPPLQHTDQRTNANNLEPRLAPAKILADATNQISSGFKQKKPEIPAKPQKIEQVQHLSKSPNLVRKQADDSRQQQDDWSVEPDDQLVERISSQSLAKAFEQRLQNSDQKPARPTEKSGMDSGDSGRRRTERKLISMTSIIHEPEDDLMNLKTTVASGSGEIETRGEQQKRFGWAMNGRRQSNMSNFSIQNDNSEDYDSDSSLVGCGRRRLEQKLSKQQRQQVKKPPVPGRPPNLPRASGPATGGGGSLVRRLAKNFDQTIQEQPAATALLHKSVASARSAAGSRAGPSSGGGGGLNQQAGNHTTKSHQQLQELADEPKSDSTWYDAKSIELLDEAEVAELLREFESDGEQMAGQSCSDAQYLTLSQDQPGRRDERIKRPDERNADGSGLDDDDDDATLNDDETLNDANEVVEDDDLLADTSEGQDEHDEEDESLYASAATNQNVSTRAELQQSDSGNEGDKSNRIEVGSLGDDESKSAGKSTGSAVFDAGDADRVRHLNAVAAVVDSNASCQPPVVDVGACSEAQPREACSRDKLVDSATDGDIDDREAPQFEETQQTNEITPLSRVPHLGTSTLNTQQTHKDPDSPGDHHLSRDSQQPDRTQNLKPATLDDEMGIQLESHRVGELAKDGKSPDTRDQTSDKQIFTDRLLAAFQGVSAVGPKVVEIATETVDEEHKENYQKDSLDQDEDEFDGSSMAGGEQNSEQSSSYREDLISLSSSSLSSESMPELRQRKNLQRLYNIVNEICTSEDKFVATLRMLNEDFRRHILAANDSSTGGSTSSQLQLLQAPPFDCVSLVLKHLPQLQALNEKLLEELRQARNQWPSTQKISHVLVKIGPFLKHYSSYIRDFECIQQQFQENMKKSSQFRETIKRFERDHSDKCNQLSVQHHLLKPIQRIPQYRLLLQQYLHHLKPDDADYEDTVSALEVVSRVAEHANHSLSEGANFAKLLALQAKIVGGKQRDLIQPGRLFIRDGELLKVCRKQIQPRWFVLLSDSLLYMKQIQSNDILYLKYELPLDDCQVELPSDNNLLRTTGGEASVNNNNKGKQSKTNGDEQTAKEQEQRRRRTECEFNVCTTVRSMTLVAKSRQERDDWFETLRSAIESHVAKRRSFKSGADCVGQQQEDTQLSGDNSQDALGELIGRKAPIWTPDSRVDTCQLCTSNFSALFRRHHCRACGRVVCSACSSNKAPLIYLKCRAARVCDQCFESLRANMHLYYLPSCQIDERELRRLDEHFKTLLKSQFVKRRMFSSKTGVK